MKYLIDDKATEHRKIMSVDIRKWFWLILIISSLGLFVSISLQNLDRFLSYPTYTKTYTISIEKFSFPHVLICPTQQYHKYNFDKLDWFGNLYRDIIKMNLRSSLPLKQYEKFNDIETELLGLLSCYKSYLDKNISNTSYNCLKPQSNNFDYDCLCKNDTADFCSETRNSTRLYELIKELDVLLNKTLNCKTTDDILYDLHYKLDRTIFYCSYKGISDWKHCADRFKLVNTYHGYCMLFNASNYFLNMSSSDDGVVYESGSNFDLSIGIYLNTENLFGDSTADNNGLGVKIGLIRPDLEDGYQMVDNMFFASLGFITNIAISPKNLTFLPKATALRSNGQCIEDSSKISLSYFKQYHPVLCKIECLTNRIYKRFGCKPSYASRLAPGNYCSFFIRPLILRYLEEFQRRSLIQDNKAYENTNNYNCKSCPLLCSNLMYDTEISSLLYASPFYFERLQESNIINLKNETFESFSKKRLFLNIYFKEMLLTNQEEKQEFTFITFISSIGGFIGLFLGASILSVIECFSFLILIFVPKKQLVENK